MTEPAPRLALLHLCDSLFPLGGFSYSDGLEAATAAGRVSDADGLRGWLDACLDETLARLEGPALIRASSAFDGEQWTLLFTIDRELTAMRPSSTARRASAAMGLRLVKTWHALHPDRRLAHLLTMADARASGPTLPVAFAAACGSAGIDARGAIEGFAYTRLAATVSAAMRLMPIGQHEAHRLLARVLDRVPSTVDAMLARGASPESFAPALDVELMTQQYVRSRLFRS